MLSLPVSAVGGACVWGGGRAPTEAPDRPLLYVLPLTVLHVVISRPVKQQSK